MFFTWFAKMYYFFFPIDKGEDDFVCMVEPEDSDDILFDYNRFAK